MDNQNMNSEILTELRGMAQINRRAARQNLVGMIVALVAMLGLVGYTVLRLKSIQKNSDVTWNGVSTDIEQGRFDKALSGAQILLKKTPNDYYPHTLLAETYRSEGNLAQAEKEYEIAFKLWPDERNEKKLKTIRKRIESEANKKE